MKHILKDGKILHKVEEGDLEMDKKVKFFAGKIRSVDEVTKTAEVVISDETVDRYKEIVKVESFVKTKKEFMKHPVLLSSHAYRGLMMQIGQFVKLTVDSVNKEVVGKIEYFVGLGNAEADWAFELAKKGVAAFSIGFIPKKWTEYDEETRMKTGAYGEYIDIELLEVSQVLIPANPSCLQKSFDDDEEYNLDVDALVQRLYEEHKDFFTEAVEDLPGNTHTMSVVEEVKKESEVAEEIPVVVDNVEKVVEEVFDAKEFQTEVLSKMELLLEKMQELSVRLTVLEHPVTPEEKVIEAIDKDKEIDDTTNEVLGDEKMEELIVEFKKAFPSQEASLEAVKGLFEEMNNDIKGMFTVQS